MLKFAPYQVRTVQEALREGYERAPEFYVLQADLWSLLETLASMQRKLEWLRGLTPDARGMSWPVLEKYGSILQSSFIVVQQDHVYCLWRRDITRDN
ncbi:MAG: hypothetical protein HY221_00645 [Candidatus Sungbacteria bacterium]|uniref:Uncharacterized protein n=1 Tax=Candidatus Sungiibacteriota bacterium TaxID=2750080 RepID=A0A932R187_9BACT|nr:hypothetical protein [Candidatus Sungbacteria bacterium]